MNIPEYSADAQTEPIHLNSDWQPIKLAAPVPILPSHPETPLIRARAQVGYALASLMEAHERAPEEHRTRIYKRIQSLRRLLEKIK